MRASSGFCICAAMVGLLAFSAVANAATIEIIPIRASGGHTINGNEIVLDSAGQDIEFVVFVSGFDPQVVAAYQAAIGCAGLDASVSGKLLALSLDCTIGLGTWGVDYCLGVDENNASGAAPNYLLEGAAATLPACQNSLNCPSGDPGFFACGAVAVAGNSGADNGSPYYAATFAFSATGDFKGSAQFCTDPDPNQTFLKDDMARDIPITSVTCATVTVPVGACCTNPGGGDNGLGCTNDLTQAECSGSWLEGAVCSDVEGEIPGLDDVCPVCDDAIPDDIECNDNNACTTDVCGAQGCQSTPNFDTANFCCNPTDGSLTAIDDGDPCTDDVCDAGTGNVAHDPAAAGTACDDGNGCTTADACDGAGGCAGTDVNSSAIPCAADADCPADTGSVCDLGTGLCDCSLSTKLDLIVADGELADPNCFIEGEAVSVDVAMGAGSECVTGGQFLVVYDPACLGFEGLAASATFPMLIFSEVDESAGTIFAAVGIMPGGDCTQGPDVLATLSFSKLAGCDDCVLVFDNANPQNTILSNSDGNTVPLEFNASKTISNAGFVSLTAPEGELFVNPDCDTAVATVTWDDITAADTCGGVLAITCDAFHEFNVDISGLAANGGTFPQGISSFSCTATNDCGNSDTKEWTVNVSDQHALDVEVQLSPIIVGDPLTRCICFDFYSDCVQAPTSWCTDLTFGFPYDFTGKSTASLKVPKGQYACITAKDTLHTLRSVSDIDCVGNTLVAEFKGDPTFDGNWLVNGNLDCWKADGNGDTIDILDFGMFVSQYLANLDPNTSCGTQGPHSDINGDGMVDGADFTFISQNFLDTSKNSCCEDGTASSGDTPFVSISVKELRRRGLGDLAVADLNQDGILDVADMTAFQDGSTPSRSIKRGAGANGARSSLGR